MKLIDKLKRWWTQETTPVPSPPRPITPVPPPVRRAPEPPSRHLSSSEPSRRADRPIAPRRHGRQGDDFTSDAFSADDSSSSDD